VNDRNDKVITKTTGTPMKKTARAEPASIRADGGDVNAGEAGTNSAAGRLVGTDRKEKKYVGAGRKGANGKEKRAAERGGRGDRVELPVLTGEQLERLLEVNRRTVQRYVKERGLPKLARDRYDLKAVWKWQAAQLAEELGRKNQNADRLLKAQADEREHKAALLKAKCELMDGRLVDRQTVELDRLDRAWAVRKQLERLSDELTEGLLRIGRTPGGAAGGKNPTNPTKAAAKAGQWEVEVRETIEAAVLRCREAWAKEPGEFDELERQIARQLAERIARAITPEEKRAAYQAAIVRILEEQFPALVTLNK